MQIECYAQRLLNPYRGTIHVVRFGAAEAVTQDGVHWDLYVSNDELAADLNCDRPIQVNDIRFGAWSAETGLTRGPIYPSEDFRRMERLGEIVHEALPVLSTRLPFPLRDGFERWLLDTRGRPIALLHSVLEASEMSGEDPAEWRVGHAACARFSSAAAAEPGESAAHCLTQVIRQAAGARPQAQWFARHPDGSGTAVPQNGNASAIARSLPGSAFPPLLLGLHDADPGPRALVSDYLAWQAVWLLMLPGLDDAQRGWLETQARLQADLLEACFRLYPKTLDAACLNAARVEARLRQSLEAQAVHPSAAGKAVDSTFYIELNPAGGHYT